MKISLDFDGVLGNTMQGFIDKWNRDHHPLDIYYNDITQWNFDKKLGISSDLFFQYLKEVWLDWENLQPLESHIGPKLIPISVDHDIDIVTSVLPTHVKYVKKWLDFWKIPYRTVINSNDKLKLNYDLYIDDRPQLFEDLNEDRTKWGIIYHQPWNAKIDTSFYINPIQIERAYGWDDVIGLIRQFEGYFK